MKTGFAVYIQKDLTPAEKQGAQGYCDDFIAKTLADPKKRYFGVTGGGYTSGLWRGRYGLSFGLPMNLVFRRISHRQRKFAVVRADTLEAHNDKPLNKSHAQGWTAQPNGTLPTGCKCTKCTGSVRVKFKKVPDMDFYFQYKEIKG